MDDAAALGPRASTRSRRELPQAEPAVHTEQPTIDTTTRHESPLERNWRLGGGLM
jgi:hypothetical protein